MRNVTIAVDAMGGDNAPAAVVQGVALALAEMPVSIRLVGREDDINAELAKLPTPLATEQAVRLTVVHAPDVIDMHEPPTVAIRRKKGASMLVGLKLVKDGQADAFVSAGSTGALLTAATLVVGRAPGIDRPALGALIPYRSRVTLLVDCGANVDAKPQYLAQYAQLGSDYMERMGIPDPSVGLINIGAEAEKGNALAKEAHVLLGNTPGIRFAGNVEARDLPAGVVDVAVCDAFVGNILLKYSEGFAKNMFGLIKSELTAGTLTKLGALLSKSAFRRIKKQFDADEVGGAPFLGLNALVVKAHGSSNAKAIGGAIRQCVRFAEKEY